MPHERNVFRLGLTVIVVAAMLFGALLFIGGTSFEKRDPIVILIRHDQATPRIKPGAPIVCGPQQVGAVTSVTTAERPLPDDPAGENFLFFEIKGSVNRSISLREDCRLAVEGQLLGDQGQLIVEFRGQSANPATPQKPIYAHTSGFATALSKLTDQFDESDPQSLLSQIKIQLDPESSVSLMNKFHLILGDFTDVAAGIKRSLDPAEQASLIAKLSLILDHVHDLTAAVAEQMRTDRDDALLTKLHQNLDLLDHALSDVGNLIEENRSVVRSALSDVSDVTATLRKQLIPSIEQEFDRGDAKSLLSKVHRAFDEINASLGDLHVVAGKVRTVTTLSENRLVSLIQNVEQASQHLKAASKELRLQPWRLIHEPKEKESREAYILDAVREFSDASSELDDATAQLKALFELRGGELAADDQTLQAVRATLESARSRFSQAEDALWNQLDVP